MSFHNQFAERFWPPSNLAVVADAEPHPLKWGHLGCGRTPARENADQVAVRLTNGTLLMFPSYLEHSVDANTSEEERISISFNVMFSSFTENLSKPLW